MKFKLHGLGLLFSFSIALSLLGYSTWVTFNYLSGNLDSGTSSGNLIEKDALKFVDSTTFEVYEGGILGDQTAISECGITFNFRLQNNCVNSAYNTIIYSSKLSIKNINASIEPYFKNMVVNGKTFNKLNPFPTFSNNSQIYNQNNIDVAIDKSKDITPISITYNFIDNNHTFYNLLINDLKLELSLSQSGTK